VYLSRAHFRVRFYGSTIGALVALAGKRRGPKVDPQAIELTRLQCELAKLQAKLQRADLIIDAQKKLLVLLNLPIPDVPELK
jgi:hypothetical protein